VALDPEELTVPGTATWWLITLGKRLEAERPKLDQLHQYDIGNHPLPQGHDKAKASYRRFMRQSRTNFTGLVTESVLDRLTVTGFRMGSKADMAIDAQANLVWQDSYLDADQTIAMRDALVMGRSYVLVGPDPEAESKVRITVEDPRQVIHAAEPTDRRELRAALKTWTDDVDRRIHAVVYLPDTVSYFVAEANSLGAAIWDASRWTPEFDEGDLGVAVNPLAPHVPVVPFINRPEKCRMGFGEFEDVTDVQDRINQHVLDRMVTSATQAFRQRWMTGTEIKGQFDPGADLIWWVEDDKAKFGDFSPADLRMFIDAIRADVEHMASITRTPPYYLLGQMANLSGDALTAAEAGLVAKARRRMAQFGESWEEVQGLAFQLTGRQVEIEAETVWAEPERKNEAASADAGVKKQAVGVPWRQLMEDLGYTPAQIARMDVMRAAEAMRAALLAPPAQPAPPVASPGAPPSPGEAPPAQGGGPTVPGGNGTRPAPATA